MGKNAFFLGIINQNTIISPYIFKVFNCSSSFGPYTTCLSYFASTRSSGSFAAQVFLHVLKCYHTSTLPT